MVAHGLTNSCRSVTDVDNIMEDLREQMDVQEEISEAISQPLGVDLFDEVLWCPWPSYPRSSLPFASCLSHLLT